MLRNSEFILNFVLNACWQIATIFVVAALASWLLKNAPARYRHTLWTVTLVACVVVPLLTASRFVPEKISRLQTVTPQVQFSTADATHGTSAVDENVHHIGSPRRKIVATTNRSVLLLALAYALFLTARGIRLGRFWRRKERLRRSATYLDVPHTIEAAAQRCRQLLGVRGAILARSGEAFAPYTIGVRRPLIVLPDAFCSTADEARLVSVIGHEMAHVARRDFLTNLICELVGLPISFHPLAFLIKRQIDRARELACDELVTEKVLAANVYARSLLWAADVSRQYSSQVFMLSIFDGKFLEERIVKLMSTNRRLRHRLAASTMFAAIAFFLFLRSPYRCSPWTCKLKCMPR